MPSITDTIASRVRHTRNCMDCAQTRLTICRHSWYLPTPWRQPKSRCSAFQSQRAMALALLNDRIKPTTDTIMTTIRPSVSYSFTMRLQIRNKVGMFAKVLAAIAKALGDPGAVDVVRADKNSKVRDLTIN